MDLKLDSEQLKQVIQAAILSQLTPEKREAIIGQAVKDLLVPVEVYRGAGYQTPIEAAFKRAVGEVAREVATEMVTQNEEIRGKIRALIVEATERAMAPEKREAQMDRIASAIEHVFSGDR